MSNLSTFGDAEHPLRASAIPLLMRCPWRAVLMFLGEYADDAGVSAQTGSAVHKAIENWHKDKDYQAAIRAMKEAVADYPLADFHDAELSFAPYTKDPRNVHAKLVASEKKVSFAIDGVHVHGTLDQIREVNGGLYLFDVKTGKSMGGWEMMSHYLYQVAAYCIGATNLLRRAVQPGALICTYGYRKRGANLPEPGGVFWNYTLSLAQCEDLFAGVVDVVNLIRAGKPFVGPGEHCSYCPARGVDVCIPKLSLLKGSS